MRKVFAMFILSSFVIMGAGCTNDVTVDDVTMNDEVVEISNIYNWDSQEVSFNIPDGFNVLSVSDNLVYITQAEQLPDGDIGVFFTSIEVQDGNLDSYMKRLDIPSHETVTFDDNNFAKMNVYEMFGDRIIETYVLDLDGEILVYQVGTNDNYLVEDLLSSITIK